MVKIYKNVFRALLAVFFAITISNANANSWQKVVILHTNDLHGCLTERPGADRGSVALLASYINKVRTMEKNVILVDCGDLYEKGSLPDENSHGEAMDRIMDAMEYDLRVFGNHDFKYNIKSILNSVNTHKTPAVITNLNWTRPEFLQFHRRYTLKVGKVILGFVGLTAGPEQYTDGVETTNYDIQADVDSLTANGADVVIALTHIGHRADREIRQRLKNIDLIIGGHSHTILNKVDRGRDGTQTPIVHAGGYANYVGRLDLSVDAINDSLRIDRYQLVLANSDHFSPDPVIQKLIAEQYKEFAPTALDSITFNSHGSLYHSDKALQLIANALKSVTGADASLIWKNPIRGVLRAGRVTKEDLFVFTPTRRSGCGMPTENEVLTVNLMGDKLMKVKQKFDQNASLFALAPVELRQSQTYKVALVRAMLAKDDQVFQDIPELPNERGANSKYHLQTTGMEIHEVLIQYAKMRAPQGL